jgi:hypothetical protein
LQLVNSIAATDSRYALPIQAADFLAWHMNRYHITGCNTPYFRAFFAGVYSIEYFDYERLVKEYGMPTQT